MIIKRFEEGWDHKARCTREHRQVGVAFKIERFNLLVFNFRVNGEVLIRSPEIREFKKWR